MKRHGLALLGLLLVAAPAAASDSRQDRPAIHNSLRDIEPWRLRSWLAERGLQDYYKQNSHRPESTGLRCVGRWSYGPSLKVSLRVTPEDTIVCLARGSGASIIRFRSRDSLSLDLLSDIDCYGIVSRAIIQDTLVFCGMRQGGTGIEVWGVSDLTSPHRLSYVYLPPIMDIAVQDTFLYATGYQDDSLRIFNVRDPRNPVQVGACSDSGFPMCVAGNYCYLSDQYGLNIIDVSDPANPHRVASIGGFEALSVTVRDTLCFVGTYNSTDFALRVYNVSNPATPFPIGSLTGVEASDIYLPPTCDTFLYTPKLHVINITDPAHPRLLGFVDCPGWDYGVRAVPALNYALVADHADGLVVVDLATTQVPTIDTSLYAAHRAEDVHVDNGRAYIASYDAGLVVVDVSDPTRPSALGRCDSVGMSGNMMTATARDSFAFIGWRWPQRFKSVDVHDPSMPVIAGGVQVSNPPKDMVLRDTFVYVAEDGRLQIVNVARPRSPVLVGSCNLGGAAWDLDVEDTVAYATSNVFHIISVARPDAPRLIGMWNFTQAADVVDTIAYLACRYDIGLRTLSVADPDYPRLLDTLSVDGWFNDIVVVDTLAFAGGDRLRVYNVSDPRDLREVSAWTPPYEIRRLAYAAPYIYAACFDAGVCILETTQVGITESDRGREQADVLLRAAPTVTRGVVRLVALPADATWLVLRDAAGREVDRVPVKTRDGRVTLDLTRRACGVYFAESESRNGRLIARIIKQ